MRVKSWNDTMVNACVKYWNKYPLKLRLMLHSLAMYHPKVP